MDLATGLHSVTEVLCYLNLDKYQTVSSEQSRENGFYERINQQDNMVKNKMDLCTRNKSAFTTN